MLEASRVRKRGRFGLMNRLWRWGAALAAGALWLAAPAASQTVPVVTPDATVCEGFDRLTPAEQARVQCGTVAVPQTYATPWRAQVKLAVVRIAPKGAAAREPVLILHGGPGGGVVRNYRGFLEERFGPRETILFDQRGTGLSAPALCAELGPFIFTSAASGLAPADELKARADAELACRDRLYAAGVDYQSFNTAATVADIEQIRQALNVDRWNVFGASYGTTVGLAYLGAHPDRIRALLLDSVYPPDAPGFSELIPNYMRALDELARLCRADAACARRFDVRKDFDRAVATLAEEPLEIAFKDPVVPSGAVRIGPSAFLIVVHQLLYSRRALDIVPMLIDRFAARDGGAVAALLPQFKEQAAGITRGAYSAVECFERAPFDSAEALDRNGAPWPAMRDNMVFIAEHIRAICPRWTARAAAPMSMPERGGVPVLVMAGAVDPITPPAYSERTARALDAPYILFPHVGHGAVTSHRCARDIAKAFLADPQARPETACVAEIAPPSFVTSALRAPAVPELAGAILRGEAPVATGGLTLMLVVCASAAVWLLVGFVRFLRLGTEAVNGFWARPGLPTGLAALALVGFAAGIGQSAATLAAAQPMALMFGLQASAWIYFLLPWAALLLLAWGVFALRFGEGQWERPWFYTAHLWLVIVCAGAGLFSLAVWGLMTPSLI